MDDDGFNQLELTKTQAVISDHRWSRDGKQVSFAVTIGDTVEIHVMDADGNSGGIVSFTRQPDTFSSWSRDGQWIAVASIDSEEPGIYKRNPLGVNQFRLTKARDFWPL